MMRVGKDQLHLFRSAQIDVFADELLEELAPVVRAVPDLSERELRLPEGEFIADTGLAVGGRIRMREPLEPLAEEALDLRRPETVTDPLRGLEVGAGEEPIVERLEGDAALRQLAFQILVAVEAELGRIGKIGAELEEERAEVPVVAVEVNHLSFFCMMSSLRWPFLKGTNSTP
jgi:hypothetical protein